MTGIWIAIVLFFSTPLLAEVSIRAEVDRQGGYENSPLAGLIMIGHGADEEIDKDSFMLDKSALKVELVQEERIGSNDQLIAVFRFSMPPQAKGAYLLPAITATIGGKKYSSIPSTYEIMAADKAIPAKAPVQTSASPVVSSTPTTQAHLELQSFVNGPTEIYPGQQTTVGYKYLYNANIDTTKEEIPLVKAAGLIKVGEQLAKEGQQDNLTLLEISQIVQGDVPGVYTFGPSILEGLPYQMDTQGRKIYASQKLTSTAKSITITVKPFPAEGKPLSFTGAIGKYTWSTALLSSPRIQIGDRVTLAIGVSGDIQGISLPDLCCQPGVSGLFRLSDLPPAEKTEDQTKTFTLEMRALSSSIKEVPAFEFSSFDPESGKYLLYHTAPIPLQVDAPADVPAPAVVDSTAPAEDWQEKLNNVDALEVEGYNTLLPADLNDKYFGTWWTLFLIPFGIGFLLFQSNVLAYLEKEKQLPKVTSSREVFAEGEKAMVGSVEQHTLWEKAFLLRLFEEGLIASNGMRLENLPQEGLVGQVRTLLFTMQRERYAGQGQPVDHSQEAKALFKLIAKGKQL